MTPISYANGNTRTPIATLTRRHLTLAALSLGLSVVACGSQASSDDSVTLDVARAEHEAGRVTLIDIRESNEHATGVAKGAKLLPMSQIGARLGEIPSATDKPVLLVCNTQNRSSKTLAALRQQGYKNVRFVAGGMSEWNRRGWPVVKP
jgi:rhodanese-related sulfurtransferase